MNRRAFLQLAAVAPMLRLLPPPTFPARADVANILPALDSYVLGVVRKGTFTIRMNWVIGEAVTAAKLNVLYEEL